MAIKKPVLSIARSANAAGRKCVTPSIDGYAVWSVPLAQWSPAVQDAILRAYHVGWDAARRAIPQLDMPESFPEVGP